MYVPQIEGQIADQIREFLRDHPCSRKSLAKSIGVKSEQELHLFDKVLEIMAVNGEISIWKLGLSIPWVDGGDKEAIMCSLNTKPRELKK